MALNVIKTPKLYEAAFNKIIFEVSYDDYELGNLFYLELLDANNQVLATLTKNGTGFGFCAFDVSSLVQTLFTTPKVLNPNVILQKDETALVEYKVKIGMVTLENKLQNKRAHYTSGIFYAIRAALALDGSENVDDLVVDYAREARFLSRITANQSQSNDLFLPVLFPAPTSVVLVNNYYTNRVNSPQTIPTSGVYVFNVKPQLFGSSATGVSVWLESTGVTYVATMTTRVQCSEEGYKGSHAYTATEYSTVSLADAQTKAMVTAVTNAELLLECYLDEDLEFFTSTQTYTANCGDGYTGSFTSTQTRTSFVSQMDADAKALNAATADANANLQCQVVVVTTYTSTKSFTAYCELGYEGSYTSTKTATSNISQADADSKAYSAAEADAQANLQCTVQNRDYFYEGYYEGYNAAIQQRPYQNQCPIDVVVSIEGCNQYKQGYSTGWTAGGGSGGVNQEL